MSKALLALMVAFATPVFAEEGASTAATTTPPVPSLVFTAGTGLVIHSGNLARQYNSGTVGYALNAGVLSQVTEAPLYLGLDFAMNFFGYQPPAGVTDNSSVGLQFLPTMVYRFGEVAGYNVAPYFGFSAGPHLHVHRTRTSAAGTTNSNSSTNLWFQLLARPGVDFNLMEMLAINVEPKFGVLNWDFIFLPSVNVSVAL